MNNVLNEINDYSITSYPLKPQQKVGGYSTTGIKRGDNQMMI